MIIETISISTSNKVQMLPITEHIYRFISKNSIQDAELRIFVPHTTAAVTINENADPNVQVDLNAAMQKLFPCSLNIHHGEGNSAAHLMSSLVGVSLAVCVKQGRLLLGTWQGVYFWEFDGPRTRQFYIICKGE